MGNMADADRAAGAERKAGERALALENQKAARELNTTAAPMFITEAYRILVSLKLHGAEASKVTPAQIADAKSVVSANAAADPLYRRVLRDLEKAGCRADELPVRARRSHSQPGAGAAATQVAPLLA